MRRLFLLAIVIAILAAFFASTYPDGLDFVAEKFGFTKKAQEHAAPMPDYGLKFLPEGGISTSLAGIAGVFIVLGIFWLATLIVKQLNNSTIKQFLFGICLMVVFLDCSPVLAARPLVTDDFYTVAQGEYELEFGYATTQNQASMANVSTLSLKRGFLPNFDLGVEVPYTSSSPAGLNDILLHAKYRFWERGKDEGLTARADFKFKNGNFAQGLGSGDNDCWLMLIYSIMFGKTKTHFNLAYVNVGMNAGLQSDDYIAYSAALEYPAWGEKGDLVVEYVANNALDPHPAFIQLGGRYALSEGFKLDAGYSYGLNNRSIVNSMTVGLHWEF